MNRKPLVLVVMDGVGLTDKDNGNAVKHAYTPKPGRLDGNLPKYENQSARDRGRSAERRRYGKL